MSAITIDKRSALVLIDLQKGILAPPALLDPDDIKTRDQRLAAASRASTLPVAQVKLAFSADGGGLAGNDLTYIHNPDLTHGFPQFTRSSAACHQATLELADHIETKIG